MSNLKLQNRPASRQEILKPFRKIVPCLQRKEKNGDDEIAPLIEDLKNSEFSDCIMQFDNGMEGIDYLKMLPRMLSAISELTKQIDEIKGELKAKKGVA